MIYMIVDILIDGKGRDLELAVSIGTLAPPDRYPRTYREKKQSFRYKEILLINISEV